jgi:membrane protein required for colicin V production
MVGAKMETYDLIMLAVLTAATMLGAWQGMAWQIASVASVVVSFLVARTFWEPVAAFIQRPPWDRYLAMLILYICTSLIIWIAFQIVARFIDRLKLKEFDRQIGAMMGLVKGALLCIVITFFSVSLLSETGRQAVLDSYAGHCISLVLERAAPVLPGNVEQAFEPALEPGVEESEPPAGIAPTPPPIDGRGGPPASDVAEPDRTDVWYAQDPRLDEYQPR